MEKGSGRDLICGRFIIALALSIAVAPGTVNAQNPGLAPRNKAKAASPTPAKDTKKALALLVRLVMKTGEDAIIAPPLASAIGPSTDEPLTTRDVIVDHHICTVPRTPNSACIYLRIHRRTKHDLVAKYFQVNRDGRLVKAYALHGIYDATGRPASATETHPDIDSPKVRKEFEGELKFWLDEWLPKQESAEKVAKGKRGKAAPKGR